MAEFTSEKLLFNQGDFKEFLRKRLEEAQQRVWHGKEMTIIGGDPVDLIFEKFKLEIPVFERDKISTPPEHTLRVPTFPKEENAPKSSLKMMVDVPFSGGREFFHIRLSVRGNEFAMQHTRPLEYPLPDGQIAKDSIMFSIEVLATQTPEKIKEDKEEAIKYILDEIEIYLNWHREKLHEANFSENLKQVIEGEVKIRRESK